MTDGPEPRTLGLTCTFPASLERVYRALTDPTTLVRWWGPAGFTTPEIDFEPAVGAAYRLGMQPPEGERFYLVGEFLEVDAPTRLTFTFRWEDPDPDDRETVVRVSLDAVDGRTRMSLWQGPFVTDARLVLHRNGWTDSISKLTELLS
jgi:uncharacterized protein YndB with AHSA1/START domain